MSRALTAGATVLAKRLAPRLGVVDRIPADRVTLIRPYPGGRFDTGDMWVVAVNGREAVGPVSESLMTELS